MIPIANDMGMETRAEVFADRAYTEAGHLVHRKEPGAVLHDVDFAAQRMLRMVQAGGIETVSGRMLPVHIDTICVHSDTPGAISMARLLRNTLEAAGVLVNAFGGGAR